jgi:hypothetical protein
MLLHSEVKVLSRIENLKDFPAVKITFAES